MYKRQDITFFGTSQSRFDDIVYSVPNAECCIVQFQRRSVVYIAPFRATFCGRIAELQEDLEYTTTGNEKRNFSLVDQSGSYFRCMAVGPMSQSKALEAGRLVVIYYASGRPSISNNEGMLLLMKDSFIVPVGEATNIEPEMKNRICIDDPKGEFKLASSCE